ncbi:MAG TPA: NAD(P)H-hydrate dehydratase [Solirubrobacteraceae bacterium]|jgi:NAD(P)H-hydrate epimerase|nr:NAD(P)H-hydrate dehydratase [Solirubrobacteraceae bacterium]
MGALPEWCLPLPDAEAMRAIDRWAIDEQRVPSLDLMERAGIGVARAAEQLAPDGLVAVLCGRGNNGGDGLVAARLLRDAGREVDVLTAGPAEELKGDARENLLRLPGAPPVQMDFASAASSASLGSAGAGASSAIDGPSAAAGATFLRRPAAVIDALLGTGFAGEPRGAIAEAIDAANACGAPVVSVDVPSGVDASTGVVCARAVRAAITVTFHAAKPGLWIHPGKAHAGEVRTLDIRIPRGAPTGAGIGLIESPVLFLLPSRGAASTKFSSGHVLVAGGSRGLTGAPRMAAHAAMRAGAGYVTACVSASAQAILATGGLPELMTHGLPDEDGSLTVAGVEAVLEAARRGGALALGPGLGRGPGAFAFARELARRAPVPTVIDADGLNAHAGRLGELSRREAPTVLTPHAGELGRLLELPSEEVERERLRHVRAAAELSQAVVVLKGDDTLVADPTGSGVVAVSAGGSPALATAGTGDVLTGVIAALLAQGLPAFTAAAAGVQLHAAAGRLAAQTAGSADGVIASDVVAALPFARAEVRRP